MTAQSRVRRLGFIFLAAVSSLGALLILTSITLAIPATSSNVIAVNPGESIQAAINAANPGATIVINPGTYTESLTLNKAVSLTGVNSATVIIRAVANQRVLMVTGSVVNQSVTIANLTLTKGNVTSGKTCPAYCGGGILITGTAQPGLQYLIITDNRAGERGGGLYADGPLTLTHVTFISNTVQHAGGGAYIKGNAVANDDYFERNECLGSTADCAGGGLMAENMLTLNNSRFMSNTVVGGTFGGYGGGVYAGRAVTVTNSDFENNQCAGSFCTAGGLYAFQTLTANDTVFKDNSAINGVGGIYVVGGAALINDRLENNQGVGLDSDGAVSATDTVVSDNQNSGMRVRSATLVRGRFENNQSIDVMAKTLTLTGTQFGGNIAGRAVYLNNFGTPSDSRIVNALFAGYGVAVFMDSPSSSVAILQSTMAVKDFSPSTAIVANQGTVVVTNTIVVSHTTGIKQISGTVHEDYNLFFGNATNLSGTISGGTHDVFGDPNFANPAINNYHIISPSAAIDAGVNADVTTDLDGIPRPVGAGYDIGAYEHINFTAHVYLPLVRK